MVNKDFHNVDGNTDDAVAKLNATSNLTMNKSQEHIATFPKTENRYYTSVTWQIFNNTRIHDPWIRHHAATTCHVAAYKPTSDEQIFYTACALAIGAVYCNRSCL